MDFISSDRRGKQWEKRHIPLFSRQLLPCFTSAAKRICPCISTLLAVQGNHEMNECLAAFTARLEPLCCSVSVGNLEGTSIGIVRGVMYAVLPPCVSQRSSLLC